MSADKLARSCFVACVLLSSFLRTSDQSRSGATCSRNGTAKEPLYVLALGPYPEGLTLPSVRPSWDGGPAIIPAARLAIQQVNDREDILCDYELRVLEADSGCQVVSKVVENFNRFVVLNENEIVGIVGPGCSDSTLGLASLLLPERIDLVQIATSTTPTINGATHRNTFRTISNTLKLVRSYVDLLEQERWSRVAVLYDSRRQNHIATSINFALKVNRNSQARTVEQMAVTDSNLVNPVITLKELGYRIIFIFAGELTARNILCIASKNEMFFPKYQFFFVVRSIGDLTEETCVKFVDRPDRQNNDSCEFNCSVEEMERIVNGSILSEYELTRLDKDTPTVSNTSFEEYDILYQSVAEEFLEELNISDTYNLSKAIYMFRHVYYDAAWALALALNESVPRLDAMGLDLSDYSYRSPNHSIFTQILKEELLALDFEGVSGRIRLDGDQRDANHTVIRLSQVCIECQNTTITVGYYESELELNGGLVTLIRDEFPTEVVEINKAVGTILLVLTFLLAIPIALLQAATIYHCERKSLKATSPKFTHFIFSGTYLFLLAVLLYLVAQTYTSSFSDVQFSVNCSTIVWCVSLGFTLLIGTICAKAWRIYRIFTHFKQSKIRYVSDNSLLLFILFLVFVDIILNLLWNAIDPWRMDRIVRLDKDGMLIELYVCNCDHLVVWVSVVGIYKGLLVFTVVVLSFVNRQIERKDFRQTRYINVVVYSFILIFGACSPIFVVFNTSLHDFSTAILVLAFILSVLVTTFSIFCPPLIPILKRKSSVYSRVRRSISHSVPSSSLMT